MIANHHNSLRLRPKAVSIASADAARHRSGYALLLVLLVLVMATVVLAAAARQSSQSAIHAGQTMQDLQLRWARQSLQSSLLPRAEQMLREIEAPLSPAPSHRRETIVMGGMHFTLVLGDELAKANSNILHERRRSLGLAESLRRLTRDDAAAPAVLVRPIAQADITNPAMPVVFNSLDQLAVITHPAELIGANGELTSLASCFTCWGGGQVNLRRADLAVVREVLGPWVNESQLHALDDYRRTTKRFNLAQSLLRMQVGHEKAVAMRPMVTDTSDCHSLWIVAKPSENTSQQAVRFWYSLAVRQEGAGGRDSARTWVFEW